MRRRVGRPGLVGTMARTAVVAGTASAVAGGVHHHQEQKYAEQDAEAYQQQQAQMAYEQQQQAAAAAAATPAPAAGGALDPAALAQIEQLAQLKQSGALTEEEFAAAKAKILGA